MGQRETIIRRDNWYKIYDDLYIFDYDLPDNIILRTYSEHPPNRKIVGAGLMVAGVWKIFTEYLR